MPTTGQALWSEQAGEAGAGFVVAGGVRSGARFGAGQSSGRLRIWCGLRLVWFFARALEGCRFLGIIHLVWVSTRVETPETPVV